MSRIIIRQGRTYDVLLHPAGTTMAWYYLKCCFSFAVITIILTSAKTYSSAIITETAQCGETIFLDAHRQEVTFSIDKVHRVTSEDVRSCLVYVRGPPNSVIQLSLVPPSGHDVEPSSLDHEESSSPAQVFVSEGIVHDGDDELLLWNDDMLRNSSMTSAGRAVTCRIPEDQLKEDHKTTLTAFLKNLPSPRAAPPGTCGGTIHLYENLRSVSFNASNDYSGSAAYCQWTVTSPVNTKVIVKFNGCSMFYYGDVLAVYDENSRTILQFRKLFRCPYPVYTKRSYARILFDAYYSVSDTHISMEVTFADSYEVDKNGVVLSSAGVIELTNSTSITIQSAALADSSYSSNAYMNAYWYVNSPSGSNIKVTYNATNVGYGVKLYVYDGADTSCLLTTYSADAGTQLILPGTLFNSTSAVFQLATATSYLPVAELTFTISVGDSSNFSPASCGGVISLTDTAPEVWFSTPFFFEPAITLDGSEFYMDCLWYVRSPPGQKIEGTWNVDTLVDYYVHIYDQPRITTYTDRITLLGGNLTANATIYSSQEDITVFYDDGIFSTAGRGFSAVVRISDILPDFQPGFFGGTIALTESKPNMTISTPLYNRVPNYGGTLTECFMYFKCPPGTEVQLTFGDLQTTTQEAITVYDHPSSTSTTYLVSYFSGNLHSSATIVSSRGGLTLFFDDLADTRSNGPGFLAEISIIEAGKLPESVLGYCGGLIPLTDVQPRLIFTSPLYYEPSTLGVVTTCWMHITSPVGKQVQLTIMDTATTPNKVIRVYDHSSSTSNRILSLYGTLTTNVTTHSSRGGLTIYLEDKTTSYNGPGYIAEAVLITDPLQGVHDDFCGGVVALTNSIPSFSFSTPLYNHPSSSSVFLECYMYFIAPEGEEVQLSVLDILTNSEEFKLYDSPASVTNLILLLSGRMTTGVTAFSSNGGITLFYDDKSNAASGPGIRANAQILDLPPVQDGFCGGTVSLSEPGTNFTFSTPLYPSTSLYAIDVDCWMHLVNPSDKLSKFTILDMDSSPELSLAIYEHPSSTSPTYQIGQIYGKLRSPASFISSNGGFSLIITDTAIYNKPGFLAEFSTFDDLPAVDSAFCGGTISLADEPGQKYKFSTPLYQNPSSYNLRMSCWMHFIGLSSTHLKLTILDMDMISESITVYEHPSSTQSSYTIASLQGTLKSSVSLLSMRGGFFLVFTDSSDSFNGQGFLAEFTGLDTAGIYPEVSDLLGGTVPLSDTSPIFEFSTHLYHAPSTVDNVKTNGYLHISSPSGKQVQLIIQDMQTSVNEQIGIYDYSRAQSSYGIGYLSGAWNATTVFYSSRQIMTINYHDISPSQNGRGFIAVARLLIPGCTFCDEDEVIPRNLEGFCGGVVPLTESLDSLIVTSPLYQQQATEGHIMDCTMYFTSPSGRQIHLTMIHATTEDGEYIRIYDHPSSPSYITTRISGNLERNASVISTRGGFTLLFDGIGGGATGRGFRAVVETKDSALLSDQEGFCGGYITLTSSYPRVSITTPFYNHPSDADIVIDCWWYISTGSSQAEMSIRNIDTKSEDVKVFDHPGSLSYQILSLTEGNASAVSTRKGFSFYFDDTSTGNNGRGFLLQVNIQGIPVVTSTLSNVITSPSTTDNGEPVTPFTGNTSPGLTVIHSERPGVSQMTGSPSAATVNGPEMTDEKIILVSTISVSILLLIIGVVCGIVCFLKRRSKRDSSTPPPDTEPSKDPNAYLTAVDSDKHGQSAAHVYEYEMPHVYNGVASLYDQAGSVAHTYHGVEQAPSSSLPPNLPDLPIPKSQAKPENLYSENLYTELKC